MFVDVDNQTQKDLYEDYKSGNLFGPLFNEKGVGTISGTEVGPMKFPGLRFQFGDGSWVSVAYAGSGERFAVSMPETGKVYEGITRRQLRGAILWRGGARTMSPRFLRRKELGWMARNPVLLLALTAAAITALMFVFFEPTFAFAIPTIIALCAGVYFTSKRNDLTDVVSDTAITDDLSLVQGWNLVYTRALLESIYQECSRTVPKKENSPIWQDLRQAGASVTELVSSGHEEPADNAIAALEDLYEKTAAVHPSEEDWQEHRL